MSSADPALEQVLVATEARLATIVNPRAWGSYPRNPIILRDHLPVESVTEYPTVMIIDGEADWSFDSTGPVGKIVVRRNPFLYEIQGYVQGDDTTKASTWLQRLGDDLLVALVAQQNLGINFAGVNNREILTVSFGKMNFMTGFPGFPNLGVLSLEVRVDLMEEVAAA